MLERYRNDFAGGRPLADIASELRDLGLATDHDVAYVEAIPPGMQHSISASIRWYLEQAEPAMIQFTHQAADDFSLRVVELDDGRVAQFVLIGPIDRPRATGRVMACVRTDQTA